MDTTPPRTHDRRDPHAPAGFAGGQTFGLVPEMVLGGALNSSLQDDKLWVPQSEGVWFKPLMLNVSQGDEDVFSKIDNARKHFDAIGLGAGHVQRFIR